MADEQELLSPGELDNSKYWYDKQHGVRDQVAKLKALGYVKWDREKVARQIRVRVINEDEGEELDNIKPWDKCEQRTRDYWLDEADQLHKILIGGK